MPGCGRGGHSAKLIMLQSDSASHTVVSPDLPTRSGVSRRFSLNQLLRLISCQLQPSRLRLIPTVTLTCDGTFFAPSSVSGCSWRPGIETSGLIVLTWEITADAAVFTARFVKPRRDLSHSFEKQAWQFIGVRLCGWRLVELQALQHSCG